MKRTAKIALCAMTALCLVLSMVGCASQSYTPPTKTAVVDTPTIGMTKTLRVGVNTSNTPFAYQVSGRIVGLDVDLAAALADEMGLDLQIIDVGSDPEGAIEAGDVDVVMGLDSSDSSLSCWLSDPYVQTSVALFAKSDVDKVPTAASSPRIAAQSSSMSAWEVSNQFGESSVVSAASLDAAFSALSEGEADYVAADAVIGSYVVATSSLDAHMVALMKSVSGYCIGVSQTNTALQDAISDALGSISSNGMVRVVEQKWLGDSLDLSGLPLTATANSSSSKGGDEEASDETSSSSDSSSGEASSSGSSSGSDSASGSLQGVDSAGSNVVSEEDLGVSSTDGSASADGQSAA